MSCLFDSLSYFHSISSNEMRSRICDYIKTNPKMNDVKVSDCIKWETGKTLDAYISHMRNSCTWGGAIEIKAYCDLFNVSVEVNSIRKGEHRKVEFINTRKTNMWIILKWTGNHYEPIWDGKEYIEV